MYTLGLAWLQIEIFNLESRSVKKGGVLPSIAELLEELTKLWLVVPGACGTSPSKNLERSG